VDRVGALLLGVYWMVRNDLSSMRVWFWQRIVTPHMTELVSALAHQGCDVTYVAEQPMSAERAEQGWAVPCLPGVRLELAQTANKISALVASAPGDSIHICQGLRGNGFVGRAQAELKVRGLRQWVVMETVDDAGLRGAIKRFVYRRLFAAWRKHLRGILAIGAGTPSWVAATGMPKDCVFPFAYFLADQNLEECSWHVTRERFRFVFVGMLIERKRLGLLLDALHRIHPQECELAVVGSGPLEANLRARADELLPGRVLWTGRLPLSQVPQEIAKADCLVLPSRHDGWGAVVSEALMVGTPVICSDACGSAGVVRESGKGGVFRSGDLGGLKDNLVAALSRGLVKETDRVALAKWAGCLGAKAGASYLLDILNYDGSVGKIPVPPWSAASVAQKFKVS